MGWYKGTTLGERAGTKTESEEIEEALLRLSPTDSPVVFFRTGACSLSLARIGYGPINLDKRRSVSPSSQGLRLGRDIASEGPGSLSAGFNKSYQCAIARILEPWRNDVPTYNPNRLLKMTSIRGRLTIWVMRIACIEKLNPPKNLPDPDRQNGIDLFFGERGEGEKTGHKGTWKRYVLYRIQ